jgi:hypothetical protein
LSDVSKTIRAGNEGIAAEKQHAAYKAGNPAFGINACRLKIIPS